MFSLKKCVAAFFSCFLLSACFNEEINNTYNQYNVVDPVDVKFATYNLSFDRNDFESLLAELETPVATQDSLVSAYLDGELDEKPEDKALAARIIQIRNVAATIQKVRPDVLMLAEFNNDGFGENKSALNAFQKNYLSEPQSLAGAGNEKNLKPIEYPFKETYATNTGRLNEFDFDLDNDGKINSLPGDAWGFGFYHGQYAFGLMSKFEIDTANTRTFQNFKWKDLPNASNPVIKPSRRDGKNKQDNKEYEWYQSHEWEEVLLSSKNHVDAPIIIPTATGKEVVHLLLSHPTPPAFDAGKNIIQNAAEVEFWHHYIQGSSAIYDDNGKNGGLASGKHFVIMGDLNLETEIGDGIRETMQALHNDTAVNQAMTQGDLYPTSTGAAEYALSSEAKPNAKFHPYPNRITSEFGLAVDYALASASLKLLDSGVFWPATYEQGHSLIADPRIGTGKGKDVNSDHRMVWFKTQF